MISSPVYTLEKNDRSGVEMIFEYLKLVEVESSPCTLAEIININKMNDLIVII